MYKTIAWDKDLDIAISPERPPVEGEWSAVFDDDVLKYKSEYHEIAVVPELPLVTLDNFVIESNGISVPIFGNEYWLEADAPVSIVSDVTGLDESLVIASVTMISGITANFMVVADRVVGDGTVTSDVRFLANIDDKEMVISSNSGFETSGKYIISAERINAGLESVGSQYRVTMEDIEFEIPTL